MGEWRSRRKLEQLDPCWGKRSLRHKAAARHSWSSLSFLPVEPMTAVGIIALVGPSCAGWASDLKSEERRMNRNSYSLTKTDGVS